MEMYVNITMFLLLSAALPPQVPRCHQFFKVWHTTRSLVISAFMGGQIITRKNTPELGKVQRSATKMIKGLERLPSEEPRADQHPSSLKRSIEEDKRDLKTDEPPGEDE